jgi:NAD(P)-dependent dehydrogenase (short-subunit alcohol dehydrogenase family)
MKTILITGASSGIGRAAAHRFIKAGWNVAASMRKPAENSEFSSFENARAIALDVTKIESIQQAVADTLAAFGSIDVLLNNAGYGLAGPLEAVSPDQLVRQFSTNVFGPVYLMQACLPIFRAKNSGLIMNVSSIGGRLGLPFNSLYHGTKFAVEGISESLALELKPLGIRVKVIEPGGVATDFSGRSLEMMRRDDLTAYDASIGRALKVFSAPERAEHYSTPETIAEIIFSAATDGTDQLRYIAGIDANQMWAERTSMDDAAYIRTTVERFNL